MSFNLDLIRSWKKVFESDLENIAIELKDTIEKSSVIILSGDVGAGKTTFTKSFISCDDQTASPTYSIVNEIGKCVHADLYRLDEPEEIIHLELNLYLEDKEYFLVEWGEDYLDHLYREINEQFNFYVLRLSINDSNSDEEVSSRDFNLHKVSFV